MAISRAFLICSACVIATTSFAIAQQGLNNLFTASGFLAKVANTPEKLALLRALPADKLVKRTRDGATFYVYADPEGCNCAYVGTPEAYAAYQNWGNGQASGTDDQSNSIEVIDSDVGEPYISGNSMYQSMEAILDPSF